MLSIESTTTCDSSLSQRRESLYAAHRDAHRSNFSQDGRWIGLGSRGDVSHAAKVWHSFAFLSGDLADRRLANAILAPQLQTSPITSARSSPRCWCATAASWRTTPARHWSRSRKTASRKPSTHGWRLSGVNNFSAMRARCCSSPPPRWSNVTRCHTRCESSIEDVYNRHRLRQFGATTFFSFLRISLIGRSFRKSSTLRPIRQLRCWP